MKTSFQVERWADVLPELEEIFPLHWREIALHQDKIQLDIDRERYALLAEKNIVMVTTARTFENKSEGKLIGYIIAFVMPHLHYKSAGDMALTDMYFVLPEFRTGNGVKLFMAFEKACRARGITQMLSSCKLHQDHSRMFELLHWQHTDNTFAKYIKG